MTELARESGEYGKDETRDVSLQRLETAYDGQGNAFRFTSYNAVSGGSVVNDAMRDFNGFGQLMHEYQEHGATLATTSSLWSGFEYTNGVTGNHSRATGLVYPSGKTLSDFDADSR